MSERRLYEGIPWQASYGVEGRVGVHSYIIMAGSWSEAQKEAEERAEHTGYKLTKLEEMGWVRGVIV